MKMATFQLPGRRLILAGGFAVAIAVSPVVAVFATPAPATTPLACAPGETEDPVSFACTSDVATSDVAPGIPAVGAPSEEALSACSGRDQGECLEGQLYPPAPVEMPNTEVQQSP
jgi:hypothetical protein